MSNDIQPLDIANETLRDKLIRCGWASDFSVNTLVKLIEDYCDAKVSAALEATNKPTP